MVDQHLPGRRNGEVDASPGRGELERRAGRVEHGLAQIQVDAAEHDAHRAVAQRAGPARPLDTSHVGRDRELVGRLVADRLPARESLPHGPEADEHDDRPDAGPDEESHPCLLRVDTPRRSESRVRPMGERLQGGRLAARAIAAARVDTIFTLSGGHVMPIYEGCRHEGVRVVDVRHEQSAAHAAEAWGEGPAGGRGGARDRRAGRDRDGDGRRELPSPRRRRSSCSGARARWPRPSGARCRSSTSSP